MTDILTRDPNDSDEFPLGIGERTVVIRVDTGEATQRIDPRLIKAPSFDAIPRKVIEIDDTVKFRIPETIGCVDLDGPQPKPKPLPPDPRPSVPPQHDLDPRVAAFLHPEFLERVGLLDAKPPLPGQPTPRPQPTGPVPHPPAPAADDVTELIERTMAEIDGEPYAPQRVPMRLRKSMPYVMPDDRAPWFGARHRRPAPAWTRWAIAVGTLLVIWSAAMLAVVR